MTERQRAIAEIAVAILSSPNILRVNGKEIDSHKLAIRYAVCIIEAAEAIPDPPKTAAQYANT